MYSTRSAKKQTTQSFTNCEKTMAPKKNAEKKASENPPESPKEDTQRGSQTAMTMEAKIDFIMSKISKLDIIESKLSGMNEKMESLESKIAEQEMSLEFTQEEVTEIKGKVDDMGNITKDHDQTIGEIKELLNVLNYSRVQMKEEMNKMEDYSRRDCLIFEGIEENKTENCTQIIENLVKNTLKIDDNIRLQRCHRLGKQTNHRARPIIAKFVWVQDKQKILSKVSTLKGSQIFIQEFFSPATSSKRRALYPLFKYLKKQNKKCTLNGEYLIVEGKRYTVETAVKIENCQKAVTRSDSKILLFAGHLSYLSNFFPCEIEIDGRTFTSVEQYFQYSKALAFNNTNTAAKILGTDDPVEQKHLGSSLDEPDDSKWPASPTMRKALHAKFEQCSILKEYLESTKSLHLVHANAYDSYWANGLPMTDVHAFHPDKYKGENVLGELLMGIRG